MTNYEWLVKEGKLVEFIEGLYYNGEECGDISTCESVEKFNIDVGKDDFRGGQEARIAEWLQAEHVEFEEYVKYRDVEAAIKSTDFSVFSLEMIDQMHDKIKKLPRKVVFDGNSI